MTRIRRFFTVGIAATFVASVGPADAQSVQESVDLRVNSSRTLRITLDRTTTLKAVGQPVTATLVDPVYAYDRIVLPAGAAVEGHVKQIVPAARRARLLAIHELSFAADTPIQVRLAPAKTQVRECARGWR